MTTPCPGEHCDAALPPGAVICAGCVARIRVLLRDVPGLLAELDLTLARQGTRHDGTGTCPDGCDHASDSPTCRQGVTLGLDVRASEASLALRLCLDGWARVLEEETPGARRATGARESAWDRAMSSTIGQAGLLAGDRRLGARDWAAEAATEIDHAHRQATRAIDIPPGTRLAGWCPTCHRACYSTTGSGTARCASCGSTWDVEASRADLLGTLPGMAEQALTKAQLAVLTGTPVGTLHSWSSRRLIDPVGCNAKGQPLYLAGPVIDAVRAGLPPQRVSRYGESLAP